MSITLMTLSWDARGLTQGEAFVLTSLCDQANDAGVCWPSVETIARRCRMTERGVQKCIRELERKNYLRCEGRKGTTSHYIINVAKLHEEYRRTKFTPEHSSPQEAGQDGVVDNPHNPQTPEHGSPLGGERSSPVGANTVHHSPELGSGEGRTTVSKPPNVVHPEPSITITEPTHNQRACVSRDVSCEKQKGDVEIAFDEWNRIAESRALHMAGVLTPKRMAAIAALLGALGGIEGWRGLLRAVEASPFLCGSGARGWRCSLDWLVQPESAQRVLEGQYSTAAPDAAPDDPSATPKTFTDAALLTALVDGGFNSVDAHRWFSDATFSPADKRIAVPSKFRRDWIESNLLPGITSALGFKPEIALAA